MGSLLVVGLERQPPTRNEHSIRAQKIPLAHFEEAAGVKVTLTVLDDGPSAPRGERDFENSRHKAVAHAATGGRADNRIESFASD